MHLHGRIGMTLQATSPLLTIGILFFFSKVVGLLVRRFHLPSVIGEIMGGAIIGPYALGGYIDTWTHIDLIDVNSTVLLFSQVAVVLIIFSAASENGLTGLRQAGIFAALVAIGGAIVPVVLGFYFYIATGRSLAGAILLASTMAATSLAITVQSLERFKEKYGDEANLIFNAAAIDDVVSVIILAVALTVLSTGRALSTFAVFEIIVAATFTWFVMLVASLTIIPQFIKVVARMKDDSLLESASLAVAFAMSSISAYVGLSTVVGAYLGGISMAGSQAREHARRFSGVLKDALGPLFFAVIGAELNLANFLDVYTLLGMMLLTLMAVFGKVAGSGLMSFLKFRNVRSMLRVGVAMVPRGEVGLVIAGIALEQGVVTQSIYAEIIGMVLLTSVIGPILLQRLYHIGIRMD